MAARFQTKITKARFVYSPFSGQQMAEFGQQVIESNLARWDRGIDANDSPAPPLSQRYARRAGSSIRDLNNTGRLRRAMKVLSANQNRAVMGALDGIHTRRVKGRSLTFADVLRINNKRSRMWGISDSDKRALLEKMAEKPVIQAKAA